MGSLLGTISPTNQGEGITIDLKEHLAQRYFAPDILYQIKVLLVFACETLLQIEIPVSVVSATAIASMYDKIKSTSPGFYDNISNGAAFTFYYLAIQKGGDISENIGEAFARIIKKNIDVCNETSSTIEVGDNFKTLSEIQLEQASKVHGIENVIEKIESDYVTNERLVSESLLLSSLIQQTSQNILLTVSETYESISASEEFRQTVESELQLLADQMTLRFTETVQQIEDVNGDLQSKFNEITKYFTFDINGLTIGQVDNPNKVVIDNDEISILVNGTVVQKFDSDGNALIPDLNITRSLNLFGFLIDKDESGNVNCEYIGE